MKYLILVIATLSLLSCTKEKTQPTLKNTLWTIVPTRNQTLYITDDSMTVKWPLDVKSVMYVKYLSNDTIQLVNGVKIALKINNDTLYYIQTYNGAIDKYVSY